MLLLTFATPQAAEYGKPEDTERRVGGRSGAIRDGNRKTHRGLQGKQEGLLGHYFSPKAPHRGANSKRPLLPPWRRLCPQLRRRIWHLSCAASGPPPPSVPPAPGPRSE